ncbi:MAG: peptide deformylase [Rubrobacter sp.]|jgi:peptide deformylase|nr:peptide deformylase [Rubrobacter sp.]
MALDVRTFGDPVLKSRAAPVKNFDDSLEKLVEEMFETMSEQEGAGLAGNQVGRLQRVFVASFEEEDYVFVNPVIEESSDEKETLAEGCLSIPNIPVDIERPTKVRVTGFDAEGNPVEVEAEGHLARIFQHEIDHLDGILILDRTDRESRNAAMRELRERLVGRTPA